MGYHVYFHIVYVFIISLGCYIFNSQLYKPVIIKHGLQNKVSHRFYLNLCHLGVFVRDVSSLLLLLKLVLEFLLLWFLI